jgi:hypothetical protein
MSLLHGAEMILRIVLRERERKRVRTSVESEPPPVNLPTYVMHPGTIGTESLQRRMFVWLRGDRCASRAVPCPDIIACCTSRPHLASIFRLRGKFNLVVLFYYPGYILSALGVGTQPPFERRHGYQLHKAAEMLVLNTSITHFTNTPIWTRSSGSKQQPAT